MSSGNGNLMYFPRGECNRGVKLITQFCLVPWFRVSTPVWCGASTGVAVWSYNFWVVTQCRFVSVLDQRFGTAYSPIFRVQWEHQGLGYKSWYRYRPIRSVRVKNRRNATLGKNPKIITSVTTPVGSRPHAHCAIIRLVKCQYMKCLPIRSRYNTCDRRA